ncbi:phage tail protein [Zymobacter palmae]|uniref:Phage protein U n=1 Tax=Zymobacter palmae TaxID=33074 RepID=A0A348HHH5_9GAMM|nr:phage tail protein [Zymobacter palmae]BBG31077.1 phage protein U [Zymobacter palmae]
MYIQMMLGDFAFSIASGFPYESLSRTTSGGWKDIELIDAKPFSYNNGQGLESLRLKGTAFRSAGMAGLDTLRKMQASRQPWSLIDALGRNWGRYRIESIAENQSQIIDDGTAMVIDWDLELKEFANVG